MEMPFHVPIPRDSVLSEKVEPECITGIRQLSLQVIYSAIGIRKLCRTPIHYHNSGRRIVQLHGLQTDLELTLI
jgi:hypothetical protein